jgi:DNA repair exonuclease SbcCD nuclease subunit
MKIALCSDIHLEFGSLPIQNTEGADVLLLAGDICTASGFSKYPQKDVYHEFFSEASEQFKNVIYIMGNHEHYHGDFAKTYETLQNELSTYANVRLLEKEVYAPDDVVFVGLTLWTDFNKEDVISMNVAERNMNDYRVIKNSKTSKRLNSNDTLLDHKQALNKIDEICKQHPDLPIVIVGHHSPSKKSIKPQYENDVHLNGAYSSSLEEFILDRPNIKLWVHGHTHHEFDYMIGETRVVCNPRGYVGYERSSQELEPYFPKFIDI